MDLTDDVYAEATCPDQAVLDLAGAPRLGRITVFALHEPEGDFIYATEAGWMYFDGSRFRPADEGDVPHHIRERYPNPDQRNEDRWCPCAK